MTDPTQQARAASIPDAAIEAAAKALRARFNGQREDKPWASGDQMRMYVNDARAALDAAAPYMELTRG